MKFVCLFLLSTTLWTTPGASTLVSIPGGTFRMGDGLGDLEPHCRPVHDVRLSPYRLGTYLVTNEEVAQILTWALGQGLVEATDRTVRLATGGKELLVDLKGALPGLVLEGRALKAREGWSRHPCVQISWYGSAACCTFLSKMEGLQPCISLEDWSCDFTRNGYRLPTEAEYEFAARNRGQDLRYPWGDGPPRVNGKPAANVADETGEKHFAALKIQWRNPLPLPWPGYSDGHAVTAPVGTYPPNPLGLYDLAGNAWEFLWDWFGPYSPDAQVDPRGPATGASRCMRGGAWMNPDPHVFRCAYRDEDKPSFLGSHAGFRLARKA